MKTGVLLLVLCAVLAAPATASAPTLNGLQRQVNSLNQRIAALSTLVANMAQSNVKESDRVTCNYAIQADNLNSVWHTLVLLAQYNGFTPQPDFPRYDDGGACARLGVTRTR